MPPTTNVMRPADQSQTSFAARAAAISDLWALVDECSATGWDGDGALPLSKDAAVQAEEFIRALPEGVPLPEVSPESDGSVALDWIRTPNHMLSLSIGTTDRLAYGWVDGADTGHAVARFDGEQIPARIIEGIRADMDHLPF